MSSTTLFDFSDIDPELLGQDVLCTPGVSILDRSIGPAEFTLTPAGNDPSRQYLCFRSFSSGQEVRSPDILVTPSKFGVYRLENLTGAENSGLHIMLLMKPTTDGASGTYTFTTLRDPSTLSEHKQWGTIPKSDVLALNRSRDGTPNTISIRENADGGTGTLPEGLHALSQCSWFGCDSVQEGQTVFGRTLHGPIFVEMGGPNCRTYNLSTGLTDSWGSVGIMFFTRPQ